MKSTPVRGRWTADGPWMVGFGAAMALAVAAVLWQRDLASLLGLVLVVSAAAGAWLVERGHLVRVPLRTAMALLGSATLFFGVGGAVAVDRNHRFLGRLMYLDAENAAPALYSALLLIVCGVLALSLLRRGQAGRSAGALVVMFWLMGLDELLGWHEALESMTGVDWQVLYAPMIVAAGLGWFVLLRLINGRGTAPYLWVGGAAAWGIAQLIEAWSWGMFGLVTDDEKVAGYEAYVVVEELLEMGGSSFFLLALLALHQQGWATATFVDRGDAVGAGQGPPQVVRSGRARWREDYGKWRARGRSDR